MDLTNSSNLVIDQGSTDFSSRGPFKNAGDPKHAFAYKAPTLEEFSS